MLTPIAVENRTTNKREEMFLIKEEDSLYFTFSKITGLWLKHLSKEEWADRTQCSVFQKSDFDFEVIGNIELDDLSDQWIFNFKIEEEDIPKFYYIAKFFEVFLYYEEYSLTKRIEYTVKWFGPFLKFNNLMTRLIEFVLKEKIEEREKLRILCSDVIQSYLKGEIK